MATDAYDPTFSNSQLTDDANAQLEGQFDSLERSLASALEAVKDLRNFGKPLIIKASSVPAKMFDLDARLKQLDKVDLVNDLRNFVEYAYLGAESFSSPRERDGLQAILNHVIYGLGLLSDALHPAGAEAQAA